MQVDLVQPCKISCISCGATLHRRAVLIVNIICQSQSCWQQQRHMFILPTDVSTYYNICSSAQLSKSS